MFLINFDKNVHKKLVVTLIVIKLIVYVHFDLSGKMHMVVGNFTKIVCNSQKRLP